MKTINLKTVDRLKLDRLVRAKKSGGIFTDNAENLIFLALMMLSSGFIGFILGKA